jgi:hypothetical protein
MMGLFDIDGGVMGIVCFFVSFELLIFNLPALARFYWESPIPRHSQKVKKFPLFSSPPHLP